MRQRYILCIFLIIATVVVGVDYVEAVSIHRAVRKGDLPQVINLLSKGVNPNTLAGIRDGGKRPLLEAVRKRNLVIADVLLQAGADVNGKAGGKTPLLMAIRKNHLEMITHLLQAGANVHKEVGGVTPFRVAMKKVKPDMIVQFLSVNAVREENIRTTAKELSLGKRKKRKLSFKLMEAAKSGKEGEGYCLLLMGANSNHVDLDGRTALIGAAQRGHTGMVDILLAHGADVNYETQKYGDTALIWAASEGYTAIVKSLLSHKADVNHVNRSRSTALLSAVRKGRTEVVDTLLAHGANVNHVDKDGATPLMCATSKGYTNIRKLLLSSGQISGPALDTE